MGIPIRLHVLLPLVAILAALSPVLASHPWQSVLLALLVAGPLLVITAPCPGSLARNCHFMPFRTNGAWLSCPERFFKGKGRLITGNPAGKVWTVLSSVPDPCPLNGQCCLGLDPRIGPRHRSETLWLHCGSHPAMALGGPCLYWRRCEAQGHLQTFPWPEEDYINYIVMICLDQNGVVDVYIVLIYVYIYTCFYFCKMIFYRNAFDCHGSRKSSSITEYWCNIDVSVFAQMPSRFQPTHPGADLDFRLRASNAFANFSLLQLKVFFCILLC